MMIETLFSLEVDGVAINVDEWSKRLGLTPLQCCQFGGKIPNSINGSISRCSYWTAGIKKTEDSSLNSQLSKLLDILHPQKKEINSLIDDLAREYKVDCGISSFVWINLDENCDPEEDLDIHISADNVKRLADLQADYSICIY